MNTRGFDIARQEEKEENENIGGETASVFGVTVTAYPHEYNDGKSVEVWVQVVVADLIIYEGPVTHFDPDYRYMEICVLNMIEDFQMRLLDKLKENKNAK